MKKVVLFFFMICFVSFGTFAKKHAFDSAGNIYQVWGDKKFKDGDVLSAEDASRIRIFDAIEDGDWNAVKEEIDSGIGINSSVYITIGNAMMEETLLYKAIEKGQEKIARKLIEYGADVNKTFVLIYDGSKSTNTILRAAFTYPDNFSSDFLSFLIDEVDEIVPADFTLIGMACLPEPCWRAEEKYFEFHYDYDERCGCIVQMIQSIILKQFMNGTGFSENAFRCIQILLTSDWALENKSFFVSCWDEGWYTFDEEFHGNKNWNNVVYLFRLLKESDF